MNIRFTPPPPRVIVKLLKSKLLLAMLISSSAFMLFAAFFAPNAFAATNSTPAPTPAPHVSTFQGKPYIMQITPTEAAYAADKQKLSNEYGKVLQGKETLSVYETHYKTFMVKWHLGNPANLHSILTKTTEQNKLRSISFIQPECVSIAQTRITPSISCSIVYNAQYPEEQTNYCGPATMAETLVEDSFAWPGANSYNGFTITRYPYVVSQPSGIALNDESYLAQNYLDIPAGTQNGTDPSTLLHSLNDFISGKGGQYSPVWSNSNFQNNIVSDIATGWDIPTGLYIPSTLSTLPGYPAYVAFQHWISVTWDTNGGSTVYYADPTYNSPFYTSANGWNTPGPYANTPTSNMAQYVPFYLW